MAKLTGLAAGGSWGGCRHRSISIRAWQAFSSLLLLFILLLHNNWRNWCMQEAQTVRAEAVGRRLVPRQTAGVEVCSVSSRKMYCFLRILTEECQTWRQVCRTLLESICRDCWPVTLSAICHWQQRDLLFLQLVWTEQGALLLRVVF